MSARTLGTDMGRTLPTVVQLIESEKETWKHFRRALRKEDQEAFDELWRYCRRHAAPVCMAGRAVPNDALVMAMLIGLCRRLLDSKGKQEKNDPRRLDI